MDQSMSNLSFKLMAFTFKIRDIFSSPIEKLKRIGIIKPDYHILDFGCGPGSYSIAAAKLLENTGKVYALDILPIATKMVIKKAQKKNLKNIETINSNCDTNLSDENIDIIFLFDVFHDFDNSNKVLKELHRILKSTGLLSVSDHHFKDEKLISLITENNFFKFKDQTEKIFSFVKK